MSDPPPSSAAWRNARSLSHPIHSPPRVLVAEDDAAMRRLVVEALREDGLHVDEVVDGGRLLVQLSQQLNRDLEDIDLIVSDIRMPVVTGLEIVGALREAHCWTPVILMTAFGDNSTRIQAEQLGAILFDKPFDVDDLRTAVMSLLQRDQTRPPDAGPTILPID